MIYKVFDVEADGLLDEITTIYCLSYHIFEGTKSVAKGTITDPEEIRRFFSTEDYYVGHNVIDYDFPALLKVLGIETPRRIFDTLGVSNYLYPHLSKPGLESWGNILGVKKVEVKDWKDSDLELYIHRCEIDVEINSKVFVGFYNYLMEIYGTEELLLNAVAYLGFKMDCLKDQSEVGIPLNIPLAEKHLADLEVIFSAKSEKLSQIMPAELGKIIKSKPAKMFKKDGSVSAIGVKWIKFLEDKGLPLDTLEVRAKPNPGSVPQLKNWLFGLGWVPTTFEKSKSTGELVPKISLPYGAGLCPSVEILADLTPEVEELSDYYKVRHRVSIFKGYLEAVDDDGKIYSRAHGFTKTLRLTHSKPIANLVKPGVFYGKEVREVLIVPDDSYIMCGSDVSSLEDSTKQHFIYPYDPKYVEDMQVPGFDPHLDIGILAGNITKEDEEIYKRIDSITDKSTVSEDDMIKYNTVKKARGTAKATNFSATYGAGGDRIAAIAKLSNEEGMALHSIYWNRNWAIKEVARHCIVNTVREQKWLYNPLSGFWLYLSAEKDRFSALNQNTGVFVFDSWLYQIRKRLKPLGIKISLQYHDELMLYFKKEHKDTVEKILRESMEKVNELLKLNVKITISVDFGVNYATVH